MFLFMTFHFFMGIYVSEEYIFPLFLIKLEINYVINRYIMSDDLIYYNVTIGAPQGQSVIAQYEETRTQPIIKNPSEYYMTVVRFSLNASSIPLFVCPVIPNPNVPSDINFTPFVVTLQYYDGTTNHIASANLTFTPDVVSAQIPNAPNQYGQDLIGFYYYIYYYTTFINMTNTAINNAFASLVSQVSGLSSAPIPYFIYNETTNLISFIVPNVVNPIVPTTNLYITAFDTSNGNPYIPAQYPSANAIGKINIYLNSQLYSYYSLIRSVTTKIPPVTIPPVYGHLMVVTDNKNNYYYPPQNTANTAPPQTEISFSSGSGTYTAGPAWFIFTQEANALSTWNSLQSIVFLTGQIPVRGEAIPYASIPSLQNGTQIGNASFRQIITDFTPDLTISKDTRIQFSYYANPYRLIDLLSTNPLYKIDLQIFWEDKYQNLYPIYVSGNNINTVKLLFIKKSLAKFAVNYNGSH
jgi:hypothetical protein